LSETFAKPVDALFLSCIFLFVSLILKLPDCARASNIALSGQLSGLSRNPRLYKPCCSCSVVRRSYFFHSDLGRTTREFPNNIEFVDLLNRRAAAYAYICGCCDNHGI
jgi:hypothetical protein